MKEVNLACAVLTLCFVSATAFASCESLEDAKFPGLLWDNTDSQACMDRLRISDAKVREVSCSLKGAVDSTMDFHFDQSGRVMEIVVSNFEPCSERHTFVYEKNARYPLEVRIVRSASSSATTHCDGTSSESYAPDSHGYPQMFKDAYNDKPANVMFTYRWDRGLFSSRVVETQHNVTTGHDDVCTFEHGWLQSCQTEMPMISMPGSNNPGVSFEPMLIQCSYRGGLEEGWQDITQTQVLQGVTSVAYRWHRGTDGRLLQTWDMPGSTWNGKLLGSTVVYNYNDYDSSGRWTKRTECTIYESDPKAQRCAVRTRTISYW